MSIIKTHDVVLHGKTNQFEITLKPLCDEHLPLLYKWCADPEVLYWTEGGEDCEQSYDKETVHVIYGNVSQQALCFLIEVNCDVRRIDMSIGEKEYWNKGIGSEFVRILVEFAFTIEHVDVLHCIFEDYNHRSKRVFEKNGFTLHHQVNLPPMQKRHFEYHYGLTSEEYFNQKQNFHIK
jgi:RimJ/RimL family protein N-acetyltransferase